MKSGQTRRFVWLACIAWVSMVGVQAVMAAVKWNQPGFRDQDITSPIEMALTVGLVMGIPFAGIAFGLLLPMTMAADRLVGGRLSSGGNIAIGAALGFPATLAFLVLFRLLFSDTRSFTQFVLALRGMPGTLIGFLVVFAVGGIVMSLGLRRREAPAAK